MLKSKICFLVLKSRYLCLELTDISSFIKTIIVGTPSVIALHNHLEVVRK